MPRRPTSSRSPMDWVDAALDALAEGGIAAVRVEAIARTIGVTKGSFYWHFADRPSLIVAMRETWCERALAELRALEPKGPVRTQLAQALAAIASSPGRSHEVGLRHHARFDEDTRAVVSRVDADRSRRLTALFGYLGFDESDSGRRSRVALAALSAIALDENPVGLVTDLVDCLADAHRSARDPAPASKKKEQLSLF